MLKVGDKVKLEHSGIHVGGCVPRGKSSRFGKVYYIHNNYIVIQFENYKESITTGDILADNLLSGRVREWILYKRINEEWVEVKEKDLTTRLFTEKYYTIKSRGRRW